MNQLSQGINTSPEQQQPSVPKSREEIEQLFRTSLLGELKGKFKESIEKEKSAKINITHPFTLPNGENLEVYFLKFKGNNKDPLSDKYLDRQTIDGDTVVEGKYYLLVNLKVNGSEETLIAKSERLEEFKKLVYEKFEKIVGTGDKANTPEAHA